LRFTLLFAAKKTMAKVIYVINGPNLNLLGTREPGIYGKATLGDVERLCRLQAKHHAFEVEFRQSNSEGQIVDLLQEARARQAVGVVLNPAGYTTTSVAILDAILAIEIPVVEVHISNIHAREEFRRHSLVSKAAKAVICGFGVEGYALAVSGLAALTEKRS
jgi:3-dehydroquinate dehydratase-2